MMLDKEIFKDRSRQIIVGGDDLPNGTRRWTTVTLAVRGESQLCEAYTEFVSKVRPG